MVLAVVQKKAPERPLRAVYGDIWMCCPRTVKAPFPLYVDEGAVRVL